MREIEVKLSAANAHGLNLSLTPLDSGPTHRRCWGSTPAAAQLGKHFKIPSAPLNSHFKILSQLCSVCIGLVVVAILLCIHVYLLLLLFWHFRILAI